jgi:sulfate transport system substrate-binding protein
VIPRQTILIDIYIAGLQNSEHKNEWNLFSRYLKTYPAQKILAENGYRPVDKKALAEAGTKYPVRPGQTKIISPLLGGWRTVDKNWFDPSNSIMQKIEQSLGVSTG